MQIPELLSKLNGVKKTGKNQWQSLCPAHDDHNPSLSIRERPGKIDLFCHTGCSFDAICAALGIEPKDLLSDNGQKKQRKRIVATYDYVDESGRLLYQVVRFEPKSFRQRRPGKRGGWIWNLKGVTRVLYNLPSVLSADEVWMTEGEKDADNLHALDFITSTLPCGSGKLRSLLKNNPQILEPLRRKRVFVVPDNDEPGKRHAQELANELVNIAEEVKIIELTDVPAKGDASDFIEKHGEDAKKLLQRMALTADTYTPRDDLPWLMQGSDFFYATLFRREFGEQVRYVPAWGWLVWDGTRWKRDLKRKFVQQLASTLHEKILKYADKGNNPNENRAIYKLAQRICSSRKIKSALDLAASLPGILTEHTEFDTDPYLLNCINGVVDLRNGQLMPHNPKQMITKLAPFKYDPGAKSVRLERFLHEIFCQDTELVSFIQRALGYSATGSVEEHKFFICWGTGRNGKSTLLNVVRKVLGDYAKTIASDILLSRKFGSDEHPTGEADLFGARFCVAQETEEGRYLNASLVKNLTGGDSIKARFMRQDYFEFQPSHTIWLATNYKPILRDTTIAMKSRLALIPFRAFFDKSKQDPKLENKLLKEGNAVLTWLIKGAIDWHRQGLGDCDAVAEETKAYAHEMDKIQGWLEDCCIRDLKSITPFTDLYESYCEWAEINSLDSNVLSRKAFADRLGEKGFQSGKQRLGSKIVTVRKGIRLKNVTGVTDVTDLAQLTPYGTPCSVYTETSVTSGTSVTPSPRESASTSCKTPLEPLYHCDEGGFMQAYTENRKGIIAKSIEADLVANELVKWFGGKGSWQGTPSQLLEELEAHASERVVKQRGWPTTAIWLTRKLKRLTSFLRQLGIEIEFPRTKESRLVKIESMRKIASLPSLPSSPNDSNNLDGDGKVTVKHGENFTVTHAVTHKRRAGAGGDSNDSNDTKKRTLSKSTKSTKKLQPLFGEHEAPKTKKSGGRKEIALGDDFDIIVGEV